MSDVPEVLVRAAIEVFREKGYERATVREIAARAGLGVSSLYFHVRSKEELCLAVVRPAIESGADWMEDLVEAPEPPLEKLRAAIRRAVELYDHHPEISIYLSDFFPVVARTDPDLPERPKRAWEALVAQVVESEGRDPADAKLLSYGILGTFTSLHRWYRPEGRRSAAELANLYADMLIDGLRARPASDDTPGSATELTATAA